MKRNVKIVNGERYVPVNVKVAKLLQDAGVQLYRIDNSKMLYTKVNTERKVK